MLSINTLAATLPLARDLDRRSLAVEPRPGTMLSEVTRVSHPRDGLFWSNNGAPPYELDLTWISQNVNSPDPISGVSEQDCTMTELVNRVATALQGHLLYARTVVVPAIDDIVSRIAPQLDEISRASMHDMKITVVKLPAPLLEPALLDAIQNSREVVVDRNGPTLYFPETPIETIREYATSGTKSLDAAVAEMLVAAGDEAVVRAFDRLFRSGTTGTTIGAALYDNPEGVFTAILGFMIGRKLWQQPPQGVSMSSNAYEVGMVALRNQCAVRLVNELSRWDRDVKASQMVRFFGHNEVGVIEPVYKAWLASGGTNEVLFGNVLSRNPEMTVAAINARTKEFLDTWQYVCAAGKSKELNQRFAVAKDMARAEFVATMSSASQEDFPLQDRQQALKLFEEELAKTTMDEVNDPHSWMMRLLTKSRFYRTDAFQILSGIAKVKKHSPNVDTREAAAVAVIEYVADWVSSQLQLSKAVR